MVGRIVGSVEGSDVIVSGSSVVSSGVVGSSVVSSGVVGSVVGGVHDDPNGSTNAS